MAPISLADISITSATPGVLVKGTVDPLVVDDVESELCGRPILTDNRPDNDYSRISWRGVLSLCLSSAARADQ